MSSDDPVLAPLAEVAQSLFPTIYARDEVLDQGMSVRHSEAVRASYRVGLDRAGEQVLAAMREDNELSLLLTPPAGSKPTDDGWEWGAMIEDNLGRAQRRWTFEFPGLLVESAARDVLASGGSQTSVEPIIEALPKVLATVRELIAGGTVPAYVGAAFTGVRLPEGVRLDTALGLLRCATEPERGHRPSGSPEAETIMESEISLRWKLGERPPSAQPNVSDRLRAVKTARLPLAGLLALGQENVPRITWSYVRAPLRQWGPDSWPVRLGWSESTDRKIDPLSAEQQAALGEWCQRVDDHYEPSIAIAERRVLSAISERPYSDEDALIDAVIAWENLFGHGSNVEMTFRVTTALGILLEGNPAKRSEMAAELRKIYGDRSTVAHGSQLSGKRDLPAIRDRAIEVAVLALQSLFRDHPALLADSNRGMRLLLEGHPTRPRAD
jgi:hypothetical protein